MHACFHPHMNAYLMHMQLANNITSLHHQCLMQTRGRSVIVLYAASHDTITYLRIMAEIESKMVMHGCMHASIHISMHI